MRNGISLGSTRPHVRVIGIPIRFHWSLFVIIGLLSLDLSAGLFPGGGAAAVAGGVLLAAALFASVLAHELGHSVVARHEGVEVDGITLWLLGGMARLRNNPETPGAAFRIAVAGPVVSFGLALGFGILATTGAAFALPVAVVDSLAWLAFVNGVLGVFNLVPAAPLDGGRILAAALWARHGDQWRASATAAKAGRYAGWALVGLGAIGLALDSPYGGLWPMLLGWFVITAAGAEERHATAQAGLSGLLVRDVMRPAPEVGPGWLTVEAFRDRRPDASGTVLPVARWEGEVAGVVTPDRLAAVPPEQAHMTRVLDVAIPMESLRIARPEEPVGDVLARPGAGGMALVFEGSHLVGLVRPEDVRRAATARTPTRGRVPRPASAQL
jgi:Zn-dependent protease